MKIETLQDAFAHDLSDIYNAEKQLTEALPKMAEAASNAQLSEAFENHLRETEEQITILDKVLEVCDVTLESEKCDAMKGLITEGDELIKNVEEGPVRDAMLIVAAQKVEHYEISAYGSLIAIAKKLGYEEGAMLLNQILEQEKNADETLNSLAESEVNDEALRQAA